MIPACLLESAAESYGFDRATCRLVAEGRESAKQLYGFHARGKQYVLRFVKGRGGDIGRTRAEMDWLLYLAGRGVSVPRPLRSGSGELALSMEAAGEAYHVCAFSLLQGRHWDPNDAGLWNRDVFFNWGKAVGDMHRVTKDYAPGPDGRARGEFAIRGMIGERIPAVPSARQMAEDLLREIEGLPRDRDSYGLIHNDLHPGNFLIDGPRIHLFDFDGCAYSWYAFDIGNALYLALWLGRSNDAGADFANDIIRYFLRGYLSANDLSDFWLAKIPLFMMCCKLSLLSFGCDSEAADGHGGDGDRDVQWRNVKDGILFSGCTIDDSLFRSDAYQNRA